MMFVLSLFTTLIANADPAIQNLAARGQLRNLVEYPQSSCFFGVQVDVRGFQFVLGTPTFTFTKQYDHRAEIDSRLAKELDHQTLAQLAYHYDSCGESANARGLERMAAVLCRRHLQQHPDDAEAMGTMAELLAWPRAIGEAEKWLRLSVATRSRDWRNWERLGWHYVIRACRELTGLGGSDNKPIQIRHIDTATLFSTACERLPIGEAARKRAIDYCQQARDCFDWAVLVDPENYDVRAARFILGQFHHAGRAGLSQ